MGKHPEGFGNDLLAPGRTDDAENLTWTQFRAQFSDYSGQARANRLAYQVSVALLIVLGAATTLSAALGAPGWLTATLSALAVVITSLQAAFQWQKNWTEYRGAAEAMRQQGMLFVEGSAPYDGDKRFERLAAFRVATASAEVGRWTARLSPRESGDH